MESGEDGLRRGRRSRGEEAPKPGCGGPLRGVRRALRFALPSRSGKVLGAGWFGWLRQVLNTAGCFPLTPRQTPTKIGGSPIIGEMRMLRMLFDK